MSPREELGALSGHAGRAATAQQEAEGARVVGEVAAFAADCQVDQAVVRNGKEEADTADPAQGSAAADRCLSAGGATGAGDRRDLTFAVSRALGTVVVTARGTLDAAGSPVLKAVLGDLIDNQGNLAVVVDLHDVTDVDPDCLDIFVTAHGWALMRGGHLSLAGVRHRVAWAFEETGVARLVKMTAERILALPAPTVHTGRAGATPPPAQEGFGR